MKTPLSRVVITGMGLVSPLGEDIPAFLAALLSGRSAVGPITCFDPASLPTRIAAEVSLPAEAFDYRDRKVVFACRAARAAMADASQCGTRPGGSRGGEGAGLSLGLGLELFSMEDMAAWRQPDFQLPTDPVARLTFLQTPSDLCLHLICREHDLRTPPLTHVSACAAGADAIGAAFDLLANGRRRFMLAGGTDSMVNPLGVGGFCKLGATSKANHTPQTASRPFDWGRDGFVLGEGAAILVLERLEDAQARGARIYAEIVGYGSSFDAWSISDPHPQGRGALQAMQRALQRAGVGPEVIDAINAHGTSTPKGDPVESLAIARLLGDRALQVPVVSTKSMIGHTISAAGAIEAVASVACMRAGMLHPTANLVDPDPECPLDYVPGQARAVDQRYVLSNSFGFGGHNAALLFRRFDETT